MESKKINILVHILLISFLFINTVKSQEQVLLNNNEFGQGLLRSKKGKCYVITPKHVIKGYVGDF